MTTTRWVFIPSEPRSAKMVAPPRLLESLFCLASLSEVRCQEAGAQKLTPTRAAAGSEHGQQSDTERPLDSLGDLPSEEQPYRTARNRGEGRKGPIFLDWGEPGVMKSWGCTENWLIPFPLRKGRGFGAPEVGRNHKAWGVSPRKLPDSKFLKPQRGDTRMLAPRVPRSSGVAPPGLETKKRGEVRRRAIPGAYAPGFTISPLRG